LKSLGNRIRQCLWSDDVEIGIFRRAQNGVDRLLHNLDRAAAIWVANIKLAGRLAAAPL